MDIVFCFDDYYAMPTGVLIISICENNKDEDIVFHVISEKLKEENREILNNIVKSYGRELHFYYIDPDLFKNSLVQETFQNTYLRMSTYYRLFLSSVLPATLDKVLYLDSDMVVCGSLKGLWNIDIDNYAIAAVSDCRGDSILHYNRLDYDFSLGYFNAGVLLINLAHWRQNKIENQLISYNNRNRKNIVYYDQDVLNYVLREQKKEISMRYNVAECFLLQTKYVEIKKSRWDDMLYAAKFPVIIHYLGGLKPWHKDSAYILDKVWLKYYKLSPWRNVPLKCKNTLIFRILYKCKKILILFKLVEKPTNRYRTDLDYRDYEI